MSSGNVATHLPTQSLPSFAQAFNGSSYLGPGSSTLPPILPRRNSPDGQQAQQQPHSYSHRSHISPSASAPAMGRKRSREAYGEDDHEDIPRVKEEEVDELECSPPPPPPPRARFDIPRSSEHHHSHHLHENQRHEQQQQSQQHRFPTHADISTSITIPPTLVSPISQPSAAKKRRTTVSGPPPHPHRLRTDLGYNGPYSPAGYQHHSHHHPEQSAPVSPVVAGLLISPDDPAAMEQVRSTLSVKQRQKALIEQRRGSAAGLVSVPSSIGTSGSSANNNNNNNNNNPGGGSGAGAMAMTGPGQPGSILARSNRTSPNAGGSGGGVSSRRATVSRTQNAIAPAQRPPSPMNITSTGPSVQQQQPVTILQGPSLARRRAEKLGTAGKTKPPDIIISPREALPASSFAPSIQSAPPVQQGFAHQREGGPGASSMLGAGAIGTMALPRLPFNLGQQRRTAASSAKVPPTPSRLTAFGGGASGPVASVSSTGNGNNNASATSSTAALTTPATAAAPGTAGLSGPAIPPRRGSLSGSNSLASVPISSSASGRAMPYTPSTANYPSLLRAAQGAAAASNPTAGTVSTTSPHVGSSSSNSTALVAGGAVAGAAMTTINESEKVAFLKPFEAFYDALSDSKQLKAWLSEQLHRATALTQSLEAQQGAFEDAVERAVDMRMAGVREEMGAMQRRMAELEEAFVRGGGSGSGRDAAPREGPAHLLPLPSSLSRMPSSSSSATARNVNAAPAPHPSYTFPPQPAQQPTSSASNAMAVDHHLSPPPPPAPTTTVSGRSRPPSASSSPAPPPVPYERVHARLDGPRSSPKQQSQQQPGASTSTSSASYSKLSPPGKQLLHRTSSNSSLRASPVNNISSSRRNSVVMAPPPLLSSSSSAAAADELPIIMVQASTGSGSSPAPPPSSHTGNHDSGKGEGGEEDTDMDGGGN